MANPDFDPDADGDIYVQVTQGSRIPVHVERQTYEGPSRIPAQTESFRMSPRNMGYGYGRQEAPRRYQPYNIPAPKSTRMTTRWWSWEFSKTANFLASWGIIICDASQLYRGTTNTKIRHSNSVWFRQYSLQFTAKSEFRKLSQNPQWHKIHLTVNNNLVTRTKLTKTSQFRAASYRQILQNALCWLIFPRCSSVLPK
jgi:hypothetical protein